MDGWAVLKFSNGTYNAYLYEQDFLGDYLGNLTFSNDLSTPYYKMFVFEGQTLVLLISPNLV